MEIFVMSYNRGKFLKNCLDSIRKHAPSCKTTIVDDGSVDEETVRVLQVAQSEFQFRVINVREETGDQKHGGLYANMQRVLDREATEKYAFFVQDDMQLVRAIEQEDLDYIDQYFVAFEGAAFLHPAFLKQISRSRIASITLSEDFPVYVATFEREVAHYSDICIAHRERLKERGFRLACTERENGAAARKLFGPMGHMVHPLVAWLPFVPYYRGKKESMALKLVRRIGTIGYFPFESMDADQVKRFKTRDLSILPIAENFLKPIGLNEESKPWRYDPVDQKDWIRKLARYEKKIKETMKKLGLGN